jgi:hypothetical protein
MVVDIRGGWELYVTGEGWPIHVYQPGKESDCHPPGRKDWRHALAADFSGNRTGNPVRLFRFKSVHLITLSIWTVKTPPQVGEFLFLESYDGNIEDKEKIK